MGQHEIAEFLEQQDGKWFTVKQIAVAINCSGEQAVFHGIKSLIKRQGFETKIISSAGRHGSRSVYRYKTVNEE